MECPCKSHPTPAVSSVWPATFWVQFPHNLIGWFSRKFTSRWLKPLWTRSLRRRKPHATSFWLTGPHDRSNCAWRTYWRMRRDFCFSSGEYPNDSCTQRAQPQRYLTCSRSSNCTVRRTSDWSVWVARWEYQDRKRAFPSQRFRTWSWVAWWCWKFSWTIGSVYSLCWITTGWWICPEITLCWWQGKASVLLVTRLFRLSGCILVRKRN